jgi:gas vesicle protein
MSRRDNSSFALLAGIVIGGAVGAAAGILFAPASGKETREILQKKAEGVSKDLELKARDLSKEARKRAEQFKEDTLEPFAQDIQRKLKSVSNKAATRRSSRVAKKSKTRRVARK